MFALLTFSLGGLVTSGVYSEVYADPGSPKTCDPVNKGKAVGNKHCTGSGNESDKDGDGIPDTEDACPNKRPLAWILEQPDHDGDGTIDSVELENGTNPCR